MKDKNGQELFDTPEKIKKFLEFIFDTEVDKKLLNGEEVSFADYKKEQEKKNGSSLQR